MRVLHANIVGLILLCIALVFVCVCILLVVERPEETDKLVMPLVIVALSFQGIGVSIIIGVFTYQKCYLKKPVIAPMEDPQVITTLNEVIISEPQAP